MALKDSYDDYDALIIDFCLTALIFAPILLVPPAAVLLVIFLQGLLVALGITLGATVYGLVVVACIIAAGLLGLGLVLLINYTVNYFVNRSKDPKNQAVTEANMEGKEALQVIAITESSSLLDDAHDINENNENSDGINYTVNYFVNRSKDPKNQAVIEANMEGKEALQVITITTENSSLLEEARDINENNENSDDIEKLKKFGQEIAIALYQKTLNQENGIDEFLQAKLDVLKKKYRELARQYHPDTGGQTEWFQELGTICEAIRKSWELALYGVNPEEEFTLYDIDDFYLKKMSLLKEQNALLKACIALMEKKIAEIFSEENMAKFKAEVRAEMAEIIAERKKQQAESSCYTPSFWQSACQTVGSNINAVYESASAACTKLYENLCTNKKEL